MHFLTTKIQELIKSCLKLERKIEKIKTIKVYMFI